MKLLTKLRKADSSKKAQIWEKAFMDMSREQVDSLVREMILSLPGYYRLQNLVDKMYETYGYMPSMFVSEPLLRGMSIKMPERVYVAFTHGLDCIEIKNTNFKVGDAVKYCPENSIMVWYGTIVSNGKKYAKVKDSNGDIDRVEIKFLNWD